MLIPGLAQSHSADTFTVVIKQSGLTPNSSQILYNDSVIWHNTDSRENITHRIVYDANGDGLYNGTDDWDSGILSSDCNSTNQSESEDCKITFTVWFNGTWGVGEYNYTDILSDGSTMNGTIFVTEDTHQENATPSVGSSFGNDEKIDQDTNEKESSNNDLIKQILLIVGVCSGLGSLGLILYVVRKD
tara:strand:+ start:200 stop:763 length:564 start_codon:yes stop_codon:yes gene_type:complete